MKKIGFILFVVLLLNACSFSKPQNDWQYKSAYNFTRYTEYFLSEDETLAKSSYKAAVKNAKKSADLDTLARIYLGECALNIAVGEADTCEKYLQISQLVSTPELSAYYAFLTQSLHEYQIAQLPTNYQNFAKYLLAQKYNEAADDVLKMDKSTAKLLSASLIKEHLNALQRESIIEFASYNGYKKAVLFWLRVDAKYADEQERKRIEKKIEILNTKE